MCECCQLCAQVRLSKNKVDNGLYAVKIINKDVMSKRQMGKEGTLTSWSVGALGVTGCRAVAGWPCPMTFVARTSTV